MAECVVLPWKHLDVTLSLVVRSRESDLPYVAIH